MSDGTIVYIVQFMQHDSTSTPRTLMPMILDLMSRLWMDHAAGLYLNPTYSYACGFRFDVEVMDGFFQRD
jgi:hypothetical protein